MNLHAKSTKQMDIYMHNVVFIWKKFAMAGPTITVTCWSFWVESCKRANAFLPCLVELQRFQNKNALKMYLDTKNSGLDSISS